MAGYEYKPSDGAVEQPRTTILKYRGRFFPIGIGGTVTIVPQPPKMPRVFPEATAEQYQLLWEAGNRHLVDRVEKTTNMATKKTTRKKKSSEEEEE
jgi:hypothetical protein